MSRTAEAAVAGPAGEQRPPRRRRIVAWALRRPFRAAVALLVLVVLVTGVLPLAVAAVPLLQAREAIGEARAALADTDPDRALPHLERAEARFRWGRYALRNPLALPGGLLPGLTQHMRTAGALAAAGELTAGAALDAAEALERAGGPGAFAPRDGAVPLEPLAALAPVLDAAATDLAEAEALVGRSPALLLTAPLADARLEFLIELETIRPAAERAAALAGALPAFLGAEEPRRYLLAAANPAELRGSVGLIGSHAILEVSEGRLSFGEFQQTPDFEIVDPALLEPPNPGYAARYDRYGAGGFFLNINMTPDFPSAAIAAQRLYEHVTGEALDGVILADPFVFAALLEAGGPARLPGGRSLAADEVVAYVASEAYAEFDSSEERKRVLGAVAAAAVQRLLAPGRDADPVQVAEALGRAAGAGHLLVYADDPEVQQALERAGIAGALPDVDDGELLGVVVNNSSNNKVDFWLERTISYDVQLRPDGQVQGTLGVELRNGAPTDGYPGHVLGPNVSGLEAGDSRPIVSLFCGPGCETRELRVDGAEREWLVEEELGLPVHTFQERLPGGESVTVHAVRETPDGWLPHSDGQAGWYRLVLDAQTAIHPAGVAVSVTVPEGFEVVRATPGLDVDGTTVTFAGRLNGSAVFDVHFARPEGERVWSAVQRLWRRAPDAGR